MGREFPVCEVPESGQVVRARVAVIDIVGMLPDITREKRDRISLCRTKRSKQDWINKEIVYGLRYFSKKA